MVAKKFLVGRAIKWRVLLLTISLLAIVGCESDKKSEPLGANHDFGNNSGEVVLAVGDSITAGAFNDTPYPDHLARMIGKSVINVGVSGSVSALGAEMMNTHLANRRPGFVVILYGANDATLGRDIDSVIENIRSMVRDCKSNQSIPILCTLTPRTGARLIHQDRVDAISNGIRTVAREENVPLADVAAAFRGNEEDLISSDGLHPNDVGAFVIAEAVARVFNL